MTPGGGRLDCVLHALVAQPEDVEVHLVSLDQLIILEADGTVPFPGVTVRSSGLKQATKSSRSDRWRGFALRVKWSVGAQVVYPQVPRPCSLTGRLAVEEQHVRLDPLRVENTGRQSQQGVNVAVVQQLASHRLTGAAPQTGRCQVRRPLLFRESSSRVRTC